MGWSTILFSRSSFVWANEIQSIVKMKSVIWYNQSILRVIRSNDWLLELPVYTGFVPSHWISIVFDSVDCKNGASQACMKSPDWMKKHAKSLAKTSQISTSRWRVGSSGMWVWFVNRTCRVYSISLPQYHEHCIGRRLGNETFERLTIPFFNALSDRASLLLRKLDQGWRQWITVSTLDKVVYPELGHMLRHLVWEIIILIP
jgi:hypothetical protein